MTRVWLLLLLLLVPVSAEDATPDVLERRLWFTLIGLPPTIAEMNAFKRDMQSDENVERALAKWTDQLLESPRFGEKWARHWLDVARYGESNGKALNNGLPYAWRYRDWVIAAINADKPIDQFLTEQIAGDLLHRREGTDGMDNRRGGTDPEGKQEGILCDRPSSAVETENHREGVRAEEQNKRNPSTPRPSSAVKSSAVQSAVAERDALNIATGFLAIGSKEQFGGCGSRSVAEVQPEWVDDQLNVLGRGILGITVACSRCHDHKFDPVPQRDYYALAGIFFSTETLSGIKGGKAPEFGQQRVFDPDFVPLGDPTILEKLKPAAQRLAAIQKQLAPLQTEAAKAAKAKGEELDRLNAEIKPLKAEIEALEVALPKVEWAFGLREADKIAGTTLRVRGVWNQPADTVPRGFLGAVKFPAAPKIAAQSSGRRELAQWLTHHEHPLTARVFVNRGWHQVFGQGIVPTADNFGMNGEPPSHPELLDFIARRFIHAQGWSMKQLVRDLVLSRAFRQSSGRTSNVELPTSNVEGGTQTSTLDVQRSKFEVLDPANRLLWRMNTRRLEAEAIRDSVLASSGQLDLTPRQGTAPMLMEKRFGGLSQKDIAKLREEESRVRHRAVYFAIIRNETLDESLAAFDFPNNDEPATQRETATVPSQALLLMNHPLVVESARDLATLILSTAKEPLCARPPSAVTGTPIPTIVATPRLCAGRWTSPSPRSSMI